MEGRDNNGFIGDNSPSIAGQFRWNTPTPSNGVTSGVALTDVELAGGKTVHRITPPEDTARSGTTTSIPAQTGAERDQWGKGVEFLMSCIAMSVGLGNVWRFPFVALENGGGAFVIPYIIVLLLVGKPVYYMEMIIGQFSSRGSVKVYDMAPIMRGVGYGQLFSVTTLITYYSSLMALIARYMIDSFMNPLPWARCHEEWLPNCVDSESKAVRSETGLSNGSSTGPSVASSSELYFTKVVLKELDGIDDGIGLPDLRLTLFLVLSWSLVFLTLIKGVKSSGKASYFLALFPYVVMTVLLIRACTLPGAVDGIVYFLKPQWDKIYDPKVWYAAVTQCFFSLSICFGNIIMYSSYNKFRHNVYRDATIVTSIDTFTSLLAGCTIFGILGHLAHVTGKTDVGNVVKSDAGLAFISYPEAIAKFEVLPQAFSVLFFLMLFVLGIGSNVAMTSCVMTVIKDQFPRVRNWQAATIIAVCGVLLGSIYVTPGGQYVLKLVDYYGASSIALVLAIAELIAIGWVYGVDRLCKDTEFMLGHRPNLYWRLCWRWITPLLMFVILIYNLITLEPLMYKQYVYPTIAYQIGWCIFAFGLLQLPIWAAYAVYKQSGKSLNEKIKNAFKPTPAWGPLDPATHYEYKKFIDEH
uniref:Transporter n=1 Tax=Anopheles stephensi TaxID=30069 RepID=A0A182YMH2_ANOST